MIKGAPKLHQMLQEDDKRLSQDIPEARHQDNMAALYSMEPWTPTDHATPIVVDSKTGQILDDGNPSLISTPLRPLTVNLLPRRARMPPQLLNHTCGFYCTGTSHVIEAIGLPHIAPQTILDRL